MAKTEYKLSKELENSKSFRALVDGVLTKFYTAEVTQDQLKSLKDAGHPYVTEVKPKKKGETPKTNDGYGKKHTEKTD
jgi:hypothetical protein